MIKLKLKRGDIVKVITGKFKEQQGPITKILRKKERIFVQLEGINIKKSQKPTQNDTGGIKDVPASIEFSNVALIDPKNKKKTSKIGYQIKDDKKSRIARRSKTIITNN